MRLPLTESTMANTFAINLTFALALYSTGEIGLLFVLIMLVAHFIPSILNVLIAPIFLAKAVRDKTGKEKSNPFATEKRKKGSKKNPFARD